MKLDFRPKIAHKFCWRTFRFLNDQKLYWKVDFLKPQRNLERYNFNNSIHVMLEFVSKLKFYFAPCNLFVPLTGILVLGILKRWNLFKYLLNYLCFWCLYSIRMGSFVPVTTFNNDLTLKNRRLRHIFKETENLLSVLMNLTPAASGFFIGQGQMQMITMNIFLFTNNIIPVTLRVHSFSLTIFLWDKQNSVTNESCHFESCMTLFRPKGPWKLAVLPLVFCAFLQQSHSLRVLDINQNH